MVVTSRDGGIENGISSSNYATRHLFGCSRATEGEARRQLTPVLWRIRVYPFLYG